MCYRCRFVLLLKNIIDKYSNAKIAFNINNCIIMPGNNSAIANKIGGIFCGKLIIFWCICQAFLPHRSRAQKAAQGSGEERRHDSSVHACYRGGRPVR